MPSRGATRAATRAAQNLSARLLAFLAERHPDALPLTAPLLPRVVPSDLRERDLAALAGARKEAREVLGRELDRAWREAAEDALGGPHAAKVLETTPRTPLADRVALAVAQLVDAVDGFFAREEIRASLTDEEKRELLTGMVWTRAVDNQLKALFLGTRVKWGTRAFQGKGFRSLGQEAIYGAPLRLKRGAAFRAAGATGDLDEPLAAWRGDVVAPMIRDLGAVLCMRRDREMVRMVLNAQMGKAGPPMDGKDLHVGDAGWGVLPTAAPLGIASLTAVGVAFAFAESGSERVALSFVGDGGSSLGEWHEAVNSAAVRRLPVIFCVQNNQTALSTPLRDQSCARAFADKALGYGIPGITIDGTDPEEIAAAFAWAADRARQRLGPTLIELVAFRVCGHAHHDDMLYLGKDAAPSWDYPALHDGGYADPDAFAYWAARDPIRCYADRLREAGVIDAATLPSLMREADEVTREEAERLIDMPWPKAENAGRGVFTVESAPARHPDPLSPAADAPPAADRWRVETAPPFEAKGRTFLEGVMLGVRDALRADRRAFVFGEDVGGRYGNAFLLLRPLLEEFPDRIINSILAEGAVIGVSVGAALAGLRPIAEMQFNDFVASGFNQLVNNAAPAHYRYGASVPMVLRMPWGGLRDAGPFHSQNTEAWFHRVPGLKIVVPSTPHDARALLLAALRDPDPVLYYEHIALYREPRIKQALTEAAPEPMPLGAAALRRDGGALAIVSYGAYAHVALRVAERLAAEGVEAAVIDLRSLAPLDWDLLLEAVRRTGRVLLCQEDSRRGSIGESIAATLQERCFEQLDAPVVVVGALDTPVPYSPPLEEAYLAGEDRILEAARRLLAY